MKVAKVIGTIWATRKDERLNGLKLLILQPLRVPENEPDGVPVVAADVIGAGVGETVLMVRGSSARSGVGDMNVPVDAAVVGIVDDLELSE